MAKIKINYHRNLVDGQSITFQAPCGCEVIDGLKIYYTNEQGETKNKVFTLADASGHDVGDLDNLFAEGAVVKVILDVANSKAFIQNANTNAYLEKAIPKFKRVLTSTDDMDQIFEDGVYVYSTSSVPKNAPYENASVVIVSGASSTSSQKIQMGFRYGQNACGKFRMLYNGSWRVWADFGAMIEDENYKGCYYRMVDDQKTWINAPLAEGVEYRTTERSNGKTVYIKRVNFGSLPSSDSKSVMYCSSTLATPVYFNGITYLGSNVSNFGCFPLFTSEGVLRSKVHLSNNSIVVNAVTDSSSYTAEFIVKYTKNKE